MLNWRARIGYIMPGQSNEAVAHDFWKMAPDGVSIVLAAAGMREISSDEVDAAILNLQRSTEELRDHDVDLIHIGGLPLVTYKGPESEKDLIATVKSWAGGRPVTTAFQAQMNALRAVGAGKVIMVSPNTIDVTEALRRSTEQVGFEVVHTECMNQLRCDTALISERVTYTTVAKAVRLAPMAEAIWLPCGNYHVINLIQAMEKDFGLPVVTNNQAFLWWVLNVLQVNTDDVTGYGRLFQTAFSEKQLYPAAGKGQ